MRNFKGSKQTNQYKNERSKHYSSYGMNGPWSTVLCGAYNKTKKKNKFKCTKTFKLQLLLAEGAQNVLPLIEHKVKFL